MQGKAPVALFVYNRPDHAGLTLEALRRNTLASETDLIVFSDGARSSAQQPAVDAVRALLGNITGFRSVRVVERQENFGLARSIIDGVSALVTEFGRVIVLEDDLETSPHFLTYMNDALNCYAEEPSVMHISAFCPAMQVQHLPQTFFLRQMSCWGWATWARAWALFEKDSAALLRDMQKDDIKAFNLGGAYDYFAQVRMNHVGRLNTWAVFWYASIFRSGGLCLYPRISMVRNIGLDGSGEHCDTTDVFDVELAAAYPIVFETSISVSLAATDSLRRYFYSIQRPLWRRAVDKLGRLAGWRA